MSTEKPHYCEDLQDDYPHLPIRRGTVDTICGRQMKNLPDCPACLGQYNTHYVSTKQHPTKADLYGDKTDQ